MLGELDERVKHVTKIITTQVDITAKGGENDGAVVHKSEQEIAEEVITYWKKTANRDKTSIVC